MENLTAIWKTVLWQNKLPDTVYLYWHFTNKKVNKHSALFTRKAIRNSSINTRQGTLLTSWQTDRISSFTLDELKEYAKSTFNKIAVTRGPNCFLATSAAMFQRIYLGEVPPDRVYTRLATRRHFAISIYIGYSSLMYIAYWLLYKYRCLTCAEIFDDRKITFK